MTKIKIIEMVLMAATALLTAAKSVIRFMGYVGKLKQKPDADVIVGAT